MTRPRLLAIAFIVRQYCDSPLRVLLDLVVKQSAVTWIKSAGHPRLVLDGWNVMYLPRLVELDRAGLAKILVVDKNAISVLADGQSEVRLTLETLVSLMADSQPLSVAELFSTSEPLRIQRQLLSDDDARVLTDLRLIASLVKCVGLSRFLYFDSKQILVEKLGVSESLVNQFWQEYVALHAELMERYKSRKFSFPISNRLREESSFLVYSLVRLRTPKTLLETGVSNGHSTFFITNAILRNKSGRLYSVDVSSNVGGLLNPIEKSVWSFQKISSKTPKHSFLSVLDRIAPVDFFLHDSDHSYHWQKFEYESISARLDSHSVMLSDDVNFSQAFLVVSKRTHTLPTILIGGGRAFGLLTFQ